MYKYCVTWHAHHQADSPLEIIEGTYEQRIKFIDKNKSRSESPEMIARRKSLFKKVKGGFWVLPFPLKIVCIKSILRITPIWYHDTNVLIRKHYEKIMKLHKEQCGCEWTPRHDNIFDFHPKLTF